MPGRMIHYEAAFEDFLRARGWPYVAVDQAKKAIFTDAAVKSFDFLVYSASGPNLLVDVKGRKFPDSARGASRTASRAWENWITQDDVDGLREWQKVFGRDFLATIVFAYWLQGPPHRAPFEDVHVYRGRCYAFVVVPLEDYASAARTRCEKWRTVSVAAADFARMRRDLAAML